MFSNTFAVSFLALSIFAQTISCAIQPAKRQFESIQDICGTSPVDCGNGWCCFVGQECIEPANSNSEPLCRDNALTDLGGDPFTLVAFPFSSFISDMASLYSDLATLGVTLTNLPTTLTAATALPTYTDNVVPSFTPPTRMPTGPVQAATTSSTAGMAMVTPWMGGIMMGAGLGVVVGF